MGSISFSRPRIIEFFILSLQFAPAGAGQESLTLGGLVNAIEAELSQDANRLGVFRWLLREQLGYRREEDGESDPDEAMILRHPARLVPVDDMCPAITRGFLDLLGERASSDCRRPLLD